MIVDHEAEIIRRAFKEYADKASVVEIVRGLERDRVPPPSRGKWVAVKVTRMFDNETYIGRVRSDGRVIDGKDADWRIVPQDLWNRVRELRQAVGKRTRGRPPKGRHLFRHGFLRCQCGEALSPRTEKGGSEIYRCHGHAEYGDEFCSIVSHPREDIDVAVFRFFESVGLDIEATRAQVAEARDHKLGEVMALLDQAQHRALQAQERVSRVTQDYQDGELSAKRYEQQADDLERGVEACQAEVQRLTEQRAEVEAWGELRDATAETVRRIAEIRQALAGQINDARSIGATRAALMRLFQRFEVRKLSDDELEIVPVARPEVITGYTWDEERDVLLEPTLRREPLGVNPSENFRNIEVAV